LLARSLAHSLAHSLLARSLTRSLAQVTLALYLLLAWFGAAAGFVGPSCGVSGTVTDHHEAFLLVWHSLAGELALGCAARQESAESAGGFLQALVIGSFPHQRTLPLPLG
jgi:hypothetical protein